MAKLHICICILATWIDLRFPLQFHELHRPNPVPNCALRHLSQTRNQALCTHKSVTPFLCPSSNSSSNAVVSFSSFRLGNNNLHLMGISPCRTVDPIHATPSFKSSRAKIQPGCTQPAVDLHPCDSCDMAMDMAMDCLPFNNLGTPLIQI